MKYVHMKYKVYVVENALHEGYPETFIEAGFNLGNGFDDMQEAILSIQRNGYDYTQYTVLPYICMT